MKSIVVYRIIIVTGFLILTTGLTAQKPAIDLISSHQQFRHPEAIIDTGYAVNPLVREPTLVQVPPAQNQNLTGESGKKEPGSTTREKPPVKISLFNRKYNPIKIFIYITALK